MTTETTGLIVTARDAKDAGFCVVPGMKRFLEARGYSVRDFIRDGLPAEVLLSFKDARANRAVEKARERVTRG